MLDAIAGDMIGSHYGDFRTKSMDFPLFYKDSCFSDDSLLTLAIAKWLMEDENHTHGGVVKCLRYVGWHHLCAGYSQLFYCWLRSDNPHPIQERFLKYINH